MTNNNKNDIVEKNKEILNADCDKEFDNDTDNNTKPTTPKKTKTDKIIQEIEDRRKIHWCKYKYFYIVSFLILGVFIVVYVLNLLSQNNIILTDYKEVLRILYNDTKEAMLFIITNGIGALITHCIHLLKK